MGRKFVLVRAVNDIPLLPSIFLCHPRKFSDTFFFFLTCPPFLQIVFTSLGLSIRQSLHPLHVAVSVVSSSLVSFRQKKSEIFPPPESYHCFSFFKYLLQLDICRENWSGFGAWLKMPYAAHQNLSFVFFLSNFIFEKICALHFSNILHYLPKVSAEKLRRKQFRRDFRKFGGKGFGRKKFRPAFSSNLSAEIFSLLSSSNSCKKLLSRICVLTCISCTKCLGHHWKLFMG